MKKEILMNLRLFDEGDTGTGGDGSQTKAGYTFEQAEEIANNRAEKASRAALADFFRKQGLSEEEVTTAINDFKTKQKEKQPDADKIARERDEALKKIQDMENEKALAKKGVKAEDVDYVMFKVSKLVDNKTSFEKAADQFLKENPRYNTSNVYRVSTSSQQGTKGEGTSVNDTINDAIRNAIRR